MKIMITGGAGFVGRHLVHALLEEEHQGPSGITDLDDA